MSLDYPSIIASESARIGEILRIGPLDARVPGCPDWSLGELGVHLVDVQRWAAGIVASGIAGEHDEAELPRPDGAADALATSSATLLDVLAGSDPDSPCWNFSSAPQLRSFWFRRQALEAAVHRWDAESAVSDRPEPLEPAVAADTIDEFVHLLLPRVITRQGIDVGPITSDVHVHCTDADVLDGGGEWTFEIVEGELTVTAEHRKAAVAIRGNASDLMLFLYNRVGRDAVEIFDDDRSLNEWAAVFKF